MKKIVIVLVSLVVAVLIGVGNAFAQDKTSKAYIPDPSLSSKWKLVVRGPSWTTVYVDARRITHLPGGIVKVWELWVPRGEMRREVVNSLKNYFLSKGKDPNNAKRFWYNIRLDKVNCKTHKVALLEDVFYSFGDAVLYSHSVQHEEWDRIIPRSIGESIEKHVCNETSLSIPAQYKQTIPDPSLSSKWKLVSRYSNGTTVYVNTRSITYSPKGIVKVRWLLVPRGRTRRFFVNLLKPALSLQGKDQNNAESVWYMKVLYKFNCKNYQYAPLESILYSFGDAVLYSHSVQHEKWLYIPPGGAIEDVEKHVCE